MSYKLVKGNISKKIFTIYTSDSKLVIFDHSIVTGGLGFWKLLFMVVKWEMVYKSPMQAKK